MTFYPDQGQGKYDWLERECEFRVVLHDDRYQASVVVQVGNELYDPQLRWAEADGSVVLSDIGGQGQRGWDPDSGHGAIWRLKPDNTVEPIVPPGIPGFTAPIRATLAPDTFGQWGGHIFTIAQAYAGRSGAHQEHCIFRVAPGSQEPVKFVTLPVNGTINGGVPAAGMTGAFGAEGTPHEGYLYAGSLANCTIYRITPEGDALPFMVVAPPLTERPVMPYLTFIAPDYGPWARYAGELLLAGRMSTYLDSSEPSMEMSYWRVDPSGKSLDYLPELHYRADAVSGPIAPADFGPYGGQMFTIDEGTTNLLHSDGNELATVPYDGRILRVEPDGTAHVFATGLQGGQTTLVFSGGRLLVGCGRKSYSTGEFHEPDGSIYEIKPA
jgi:hypothetical protein